MSVRYAFDVGLEIEDKELGGESRRGCQHLKYSQLRVDFPSSVLCLQPDLRVSFFPVPVVAPSLHALLPSLLYASYLSDRNELSLELISPGGRITIQSLTSLPLSLDQT